MMCMAQAGPTIRKGRGSKWLKTCLKTMALKAILQKEAGGFIELPRVIRDAKGKDLAEWEAILELPDGCVVFLEAKFRMSMAHVKRQPERMSKSLRAMGKECHVKLFLAGYYWHDHKTCIEFTRSQGYGIIKPNGRDMDVEVMAVEKQL